MIALLAAVVLVPLVVSLLTIIIGGSRLQTQVLGRSMQGSAGVTAGELRLSLRKNIELLTAIFEHNSTIIDTLNRSSKRRPQELSQLDSRWPRLPSDNPTMQKVLSNPAVKDARDLIEADPSVVEIILTDRFGQLVAATGKTTDFYQGDEIWWQEAFNAGKGQIYLSDAEPDVLARIGGITAATPIRSGQNVVGVARIVIDVNRWLNQIGHLDPSEGVLLLVRNEGSRGIITAAAPGARPSPQALQWDAELSGAETSAWRVADGGLLQAYYPVEPLISVGRDPAIMPRWILVMQVPLSQALGGMSRLTVAVAALGTLVIVGLFLVGYLLADRSIVRRIRHLEAATRRVAEGDLTYRVASETGGRRLLGLDEINDLVDDFNRMVQHVQESHQALREANEMKTNFIRIAGHELRTPVSYMIGLDRLLQDSNDTQRIKEGLHAIGNRARRLNETIRSIFKIMPGQRYTEGVHYSDVDVRDLIEQARAESQPFIEQRRQKLEIAVGDDVSVVQADRDKLHDVLENLVMNAIKFTPDGGAVGVSAGLQLGGYLSIKVSDQGPGIAEADLPHIFDSFFSTGDVMKHSSGQSGYQKRGMGLGLTIVKYFVELHSGDVHVTTGPHGSTFTVTIPLERPASSLRPTTPA
ncbi:MAG: HAMP domain-containing protein [Planctomycetaceae bacterium]|nr:HAMP domain-containing protein [Planctomycetaceae bacterium]